MALKEFREIYWSPRAIKDFDSITGYIKNEFGDAALQKFVRRTTLIIGHISQNPKSFKASEKHPNKRIAILTKQTTLYFKVKARKHQIELLFFWDTRRNPASMKL